jgi:hypothetical protein
MMRSPDRSAWSASLRRLTILGLGADYFRLARARHLLSRPSMCPCENARMDGLACPCGLGDDYALCCGRFHAGAPVPTAESLMRSRYSAFAIGDAGYLLRTWHPSRRPRTLNLDPALRWTRLAVLETRRRALRRHRHRAVPCHVHPAGAAWRPRGDEQVRPARQALDLPRSH